MVDKVGEEFSEFLGQFNWLPPEDRRFLIRLVVELGRRAPAGDAPGVDEHILQVTREIAPHRVRWVARRLGL